MAFSPVRLAILCVAGVLAGCATKAPGKVYFVKPSKFPVKVGKQPNAQDGSIFPAASTGSLYGNQRNWAVGDIVTLNVSLSSTAKDANAGSLKRNSSVNASVGAALGVPLHLGSLNGTPFSPKFSTSDKSNFSGKGSTSGSNTVTTQLAAVVTAVKPNGVLGLAGHTNVNINGNVTGIEVTGYARAQDIGANDTLNSAQLADANIQYVGVGSVNSAHHVPWLQSTISKYSPF